MSSTTANPIRSLERRLLLPLLVIGAAVATLAVWGIHTQSRRQLLEKMRQRAELVANMVNHAAESVSHRSDLQRIVSALGAESEVNLVVVVGGRPARVLAATRKAWRGKPLAELPVSTVAEDLEEAIRTRQARSRLHAESAEYDFTRPLVLRQPELADGSLMDGAVMVHLDVRPTYTEIRQASLQFAVAFLAILAGLTGLGYGLLKRHVLRPIGALAKYIEHRRQGGDLFRAQAATGDEVGALARTLDDALARADSALHELENQKFALDEHAIVAVLDVEGRITSANDRCCAITRYSRQELVGQKHRLLSSGRHPAEFYDAMASTVAQGGVWHGEICHRAKDGGTYWTDSTIVPLPGKEGKSDRYIAIGTDVTERKRSEQALRESEEKFHQLADTLADVFWITSPDMQKLYYVSPAYGPVWGRSAARLYTHPREWTDAILPDDRERVFAAYARLETDHPSVTTEYRIERPDGAVRWIQGRGFQVRDATGKVVRITGVCSDITERKEAEAEIRLSELRFRSLVEATTAIVWRTPASGEFQSEQPGWTAFTGQSFEQLRGWGWLDAIHPDDRTETVRVWSAALASRQIYEMEQRLQRHDAVYRNMMIRAVPIMAEDGTVREWVGVHTDVTEQRQAEDALRLTQTSVEQSPDGVCWLDSEARFVYANEAACRSLGYSREELLAMQLPEVSPDFHLQDWSALWMNRTLKGVMEGMHRAKDGRVFPVEVMFSPVVFADREVVCAYTRDITERKRADAELGRVHRELLDISRQAGMAEVATTVLHDVGNVLNSVNVSCAVIAGTVRRSHIGNVAEAAALLQKHAGNLATFFTSDPTGQKLPDFLRKLAARLVGEQVSLLEEIRLLSQNIEHIKKTVARQQYYGKVSGLTELVSVTDLVEESLRMNATSLALHDVQTAREYAEVPPITVEKHKVLQILVNLIRNANHACGETRRADKQITVRVTSGHDGVRVVVIDNGVGIPRENLTRIFSHGFTTRKNGHGFGLHGAVLAAHEMGGTLTAQSDGPGTGATFTLQLPFVPGGNS